MQGCEAPAKISDMREGNEGNEGKSSRQICSVYPSGESHLGRDRLITGFQIQPSFLNFVAFGHIGDVYLLKAR